MNVDRCSRAVRAAILCLALSPSLLAAEGERVWTGRGGSQVRPIPSGMMSLGYGGMSMWHRARPDEHASALRAELAALRLAEATDGPSPEIEAARLDLWIRACDDQPFDGQGELLVELALERAESLAARGETEAALAATQELLVPARLAPQAGDLELREADAAWLERVAAWLADPRLVAMRTHIARPQEVPPTSTDVDQVIEQHLIEGNVDAVLQFGARAVPVAEHRILEHPSEYRALGADDPLTVLFKLDEARGARFALERLEDLGDVFSLRVLRAMREASVMRNDDTWNIVDVERSGRETKRAELLQPAWREVLERLAAQGALASDALTEVGLLVEMDALSPRLAASLEAAIRGEDPTRFQRALAALKDAGMRDTARPLLGRLLDHPLPHVRAYVAQRLVLFDEVPELWPLADDSAAEVRREVVEALRPRRRYVLFVGGIGGTQLISTNAMSDRGLSRGGLAALERLLQDHEPDIYLQALGVLNTNRDLPLSRECLRNLTGHADPRVRSQLPHVLVGALPDPAVLEILAGDPDGGVVESVDASLRMLSEVGPLPTEQNPLKAGWKVFLGASTSWDDAYLPAVRRRLMNAAVPRESLRWVIHVAALTPQGAESLADLALKRAEPALASFLVQCFSYSMNWARGVTPWNLLDSGVARDLLALAWGTPPDPDWVESVLKCLHEAPAAYRSAAAEWLADESLPTTVRFLGAWISAPIADEDWRAGLLALLAETGPESREALRRLEGQLHSVGAFVGNPDLAGRLIDDLAQRPDLPEEFAARLVRGLSGKADLSPAAAERVLMRWANSASTYRNALYAALRAVQASEAEPRVPLFERLLGSDDSDVVEATLQAMARTHVRAHLPLLERALGGEFAPSANDRKELQGAAAQALACYLDEEAAQILLRGVGMTTDSGVRDACFAALDTIRRYQDERARWNSRADAGRARAEAIAELVGLIEAGDAAQKVEAVRALGTLEALEELPRLVRLAGSKDAALAKSAREALERIHAAGKRD